MTTWQTELIYGRSAPLYRQAGWQSPLPVVGKDRNLPDGFTGYDGVDPSERDVGTWINDRPGDNVCVRLSDDVIGIDVDAYDGRNGARTIQFWTEQLGVPLPPTWKSTSRSDGDSGIYFFRVPHGRRWKSALGKDSHVEIIRRHHRYAVVWPSRHPDTNRPYLWYSPAGQVSLDAVPDIESLATLPDEWVEALAKGSAGVGGAGGVGGDGSTRGTGDHSDEDVETVAVDGEPVDVSELLREGISVGSQNEVLYRYLSSMRARGFKREEMMILGGHVLNISPTGDQHDPWTPDQLATMVDRVRSEFRAGLSSSLTPAQREFLQRWHTGEVDVDESVPPEELATDMGNSLRFARLYKDRVRYAADEARWYIWDGNRWEVDRTNQVMELTTTVIDDIRLQGMTESDQEDQERWVRHAFQSEALARRKAIIDGARSHPDLVVTADRFDRDPWLLVVKNGTVDLRTGELRPSDPADLCTKQTAASFDPEADCPRWKDHVKFITCGNVDLAGYLMTMAGYSLTGLTSERSFYFLEGRGRNGKNVFVEPIMQVMGDYAGTASPALLSGGDEQHPTILADLRGTRFVFIDEVREGRQLNAERLKALTGSKRIKARRMREDFFEFDAQFKIWMAGNGQPKIKDTSDGSWDRLKRVPFEARVPDGKLVRDLAEELFCEEADGILRWLLQGIARWNWYQAQGRAVEVPEQVKTAVAEHRHSEDTVELWLEEEPIVADPESRISVPDAYDRFNIWQIRSGYQGYERLSKQAFGQRFVVKLNVQSTPATIDRKSVRVYKGIRFENDGPAT